MSLGHEHGFVLIGLAGPMDVVNLSLQEPGKPAFKHDRYHDQTMYLHPRKWNYPSNIMTHGAPYWSTTVNTGFKVVSCSEHDWPAAKAADQKAGPADPYVMNG